MEEYEPTMMTVNNGRCKLGSSNTDLNLQKIVTADTLVVHLMVGIISIATALVLDKCEAAWSVT
jgi:hypothetical protein